jgi:hypothetical protein
VSDDTALSLEGPYDRFDETVDFDTAGGDTSVTLDDALSVMMKFSIRTN